jgi:alpha-L-fucosidase
MHRLLPIIVCLLVSVSSLSVAQTNPNRMTWFRDARFGMFIHWGLYAIPAGEWKGKQIPGIGEWIMNRAKIPVAEYEQLAKQFNPVDFDAERWVRTAQAAGQKYMVITAKHHDGFAMFHSKVSKYNVYDATPFHRDPIAELAAACKRHHMPLGFYYSQTQDWHEPDGNGNTWDFDPSKANFDKYLHEKAIPQVRELLTNYGPVALIWFDTPRIITDAQSKELADVVHTLQPKCLVDGRIGNDKGDYRSTGDNEIPVKVLDYDWETPVTTNDTWGFKTNDTNWKSAQTLIRQLVDVASKNGNYLLNVGPTAKGDIPQPAVERLQQVGAWLKVRGAVVYGAKPSPYPYEFNWGSVTSKNNRLFLNIVEWPASGSFELYGLSNRVRKASVLGDKNSSLKFQQNKTDGHDALRIDVPSAAPNSDVSVVALDLNGTPQVNTGLVQQPDETITLNCALGKLPATTKLKVSNRGITSGWVDTAETIEWDFESYRPGNYEVLARTAPERSAGGWDASAQWEQGNELQVTVGNKKVAHALHNDGTIPDPRNPLTPDIKSRLGTISLEPGTHHLKVEALKIGSERKLGVRLREIELVPAGQ